MVKWARGRAQEPSWSRGGAELAASSAELRARLSLWARTAGMGPEMGRQLLGRVRSGRPLRRRAARPPAQPLAGKMGPKAPGLHDGEAEGEVGASSAGEEGGGQKGLGRLGGPRGLLHRSEGVPLPSDGLEASLGPVAPASSSNAEAAERASSKARWGRPPAWPKAAATSQSWPLSEQEWRRQRARPSSESMGNRGARPPRASRPPKKGPGGRGPARQSRRRRSRAAGARWRASAFQNREAQRNATRRCPSGAMRGVHGALGSTR